MKLEINITKKYVWMLSAVIVLVGAALFAIAQTAPNAGGVWHALQLISTDSAGGTSVDADGNGVIDAAEGWRLLASGSDWTEEARITLNKDGVSFETDTYSGYNAQRVNVGNFEWPKYSPKELTFKAKNIGDGFCVGGESELAFGAAGGVSSKCTDYWYVGSTLTKKPTTQLNWIRMKINGNKKTTCPDIFGRTPSEGYPGTFGHPYFDIFCLYKQGTDWTGEITEIVVEEADWSAEYSRWEWEIWYR